MSAKQRYDFLTGDRNQYLTVARRASDLTLPYLIRDDDDFTKQAQPLPSPWQSVGAKGVVTLASKLMLALLPPQTSFFKLQVDEGMLGQYDPNIKSELDLAFAKIERTIMEAIAASDDRVVVHQALKHLIVGGNALIYMGKEGLRLYPLNRYVVDRDGDGASPFQKFFKITLPQITAVISILFMIRFIWNFNKFEDVFLLTGGASGTRTLPINVYQQGFAISDIGMGSAVSIVIVVLLLMFMFFYFKLLGKRVDEN